MSAFILYLEQNGGCDYSIGCGYQLVPLRASNRYEAVQVARKLILSDYQNERRVDGAMLYECVDETRLPVSNWYENDRLQKEAINHDKEERAEYERLKQKFEVTP